MEQDDAMEPSDAMTPEHKHLNEGAELYRAAASGNLEEVDRLTKDGVDSNVSEDVTA